MEETIAEAYERIRQIDYDEAVDYIYDLEQKIKGIEKYIKENACYDEKYKKCKCSFSSMALDNILYFIESSGDKKCM